ncbi:MAG: hypothetical protein LBP26_06400 [Clostridiales bacterium]|jgi:hypothetical protein|nr:hypothetical protein [Clostridiales bacterium]
MTAYEILKQCDTDAYRTVCSRDNRRKKFNRFFFIFGQQYKYAYFLTQTFRTTAARNSANTARYYFRKIAEYWQSLGVYMAVWERSPKGFLHIHAVLFTNKFQCVKLYNERCRALAGNNSIKQITDLSPKIGSYVSKYVSKGIAVDGVSSRIRHNLGGRLAEHLQLSDINEFMFWRRSCKFPNSFERKFIRRFPNARLIAGECEGGAFTCYAPPSRQSQAQKNSKNNVQIDFWTELDREIRGIDE